MTHFLLLLPYALSQPVDVQPWGLEADKLEEWNRGKIIATAQNFARVYDSFTHARTHARLTSNHALMHASSVSWKPQPTS
jgi:hypothetical protein